MIGEFIVLVAVMLQELMQPFNYELVGVSGYVGLYYLIPLGIESTVFTYLVRNAPYSKINVVLIGMYGCSCLNYTIGLIGGLMYDYETFLDDSAMNALEELCTNVEITLGVLVVVTVLYSGTERLVGKKG